MVGRGERRERETKQREDRGREERGREERGWEEKGEGRIREKKKIWLFRNLAISLIIDE